MIDATPEWYTPEVSPEHVRGTVVVAFLSAACAQPSDPTAEADATTEDGSTTGEDSETTGEDSETTGEDPDTTGDGDPEPGPCGDSRDCWAGHACIDQQCTPVEQVPECPAPMFTNLGLPSQNGLIVAIDIVDLDQDGADDVIAWNHALGIMVLSDGEWLVSPYPQLPEYQWPSLTTVLVDEDEHFDVVLNGDLINDHFAVGLGDGAGQFQFQPDLENALTGFRHLQRIVLEPDRVHAVGVGHYAESERAMVLRFSPGLVPETIDVPVEGSDFMLAEFDGTIGDELLIRSYMDECVAFTVRYVVGTEAFDSVEREVRPQYSIESCSWLAADLDGNGRDELVVAEELPFKPTAGVPEEILLSVYGNKTTPQSDASFYPRELARVPEQNYSYYPATPWLVLDLDGDNRDELLLKRLFDPGALLIWATDGQHLGCRVSLDFPTWPDTMRAGDLDGDGDDELLVLQANGLLVVRDRI